MQYTIEARELTREYTPKTPTDGQPRRTLIEARDPGEAISRFVSQSDSELVSVINPLRGHESIATIKKDDCVYLVRIYAA